jgi:hypothetical protein
MSGNSLSHHTHHPFVIPYSTTPRTLRLPAQQITSNPCKESMKILLELRQHGVVLPHTLDLRSPIRFRHLSKKYQMRWKDAPHHWAVNNGAETLQQAAFCSGETL